MNLSDEKAVKKVTANPLGYAVIALTIAVVYLYHTQMTLNVFIRESLMTANKEMREVISTNTAVIQNIKNK